MADKEIRDGLYLFYIKEQKIYPVGLTEEQWSLLQTLGNTIAGDPVRIINKIIGDAIHLK